MEAERSMYKYPFAIKNPGQVICWVMAVILVVLPIGTLVTFCRERDVIFLVATLILTPFAIVGVIAARKEFKDWIQVTGSRLEIYKDRKLIETMDAQDVAYIIQLRVYGTAGVVTGKTTLYGEGGREIISFGSIKPEYLDRLIELVGREKFLAKKQGNCKDE